MRLRRRKRKPTLVIPSVVVRGHPTEVGVPAVTDDEFLFGAPGYERPESRLTLPRDLRAINALYNGIRPPRNGEQVSTVSYDPESATEQLLRHASGR